MKKVTPDVENPDVDVLNQLGRAVRVLYGSRNQDLEHEAFLRTVRAFRRNRKVYHPQAFVWKIVKDTVADHWRKQSRDKWEDFGSVPEHLLATRPDVDSHLDQQRRIRQLREAILELSCAVRGPVYLYYVEAYSIDTLARIYGKSPSAIKMALHRGRLQLFRMFPRERD